MTGIRYWLKAFGVFDDEQKQLSELAIRLFADDGWDPYLEDQGTLWLLHYLLVKNSYASSYHLVFSELRKRRPEFNESHFNHWVEQSGGSISPIGILPFSGIYRLVAYS